MSDFAADLLPLPAAGADRAGAVQHANRADWETAALLALLRGRRPGRSWGGSGCRVEAARTPVRDARLGVINSATVTADITVIRIAFSFRIIGNMPVR
jgi:hypothetical protein